MGTCCELLQKGAGHPEAAAPCFARALSRRDRARRHHIRPRQLDGGQSNLVTCFFFAALALQFRRLASARMSPHIRTPSTNAFRSKLQVQSPGSGQSVDGGNPRPVQGPESKVQGVVPERGSLKHRIGPWFTRSARTGAGPPPCRWRSAMWRAGPRNPHIRGTVWARHTVFKLGSSGFMKLDRA